MPIPPRKLTANPARPARYFPGKVTAPEPSSSEDESDEEQPNEPPTQAKTDARPAASTFPSRTSQVTSNLKKVDITAKPAAKPPPTEPNEADFETEESASDREDEDQSGTGSGSEETTSGSEEESSSEDEAAARRRNLIRPTFVSKNARAAVVVPEKTEDERWAEEEARKKERADTLVQTQLDRNAAARAAGKKFWDDEDVVDEVDDTDDLDPEGEYAAWRLRELKRVKRERDALVAAEKEREEIERRRNLSKEEREAEDRAHLEAQAEEREGKGKMGFMQRYFHKGAFFSEDTAAAGLDRRDVMGGRYEDDVTNREVLPEYMQIRDMTKLGKKGRTRYKDMRSEDTGRWGDVGGRGRGRGRDDERGLDERFRSDHDREGPRGATGANASYLGERKRFGEFEGRENEKRARVD